MAGAWGIGARFCAVSDVLGVAAFSSFVSELNSDVSENDSADVGSETASEVDAFASKCVFGLFWSSNDVLSVVTAFRGELSATKNSNW